MRLNDWQLAFEAYLLGEQAQARAVLQDSLIGGPTLDVETGLAIYHNAYMARLQEVMGSDFPAIRHWLGDAEFQALTQAYIRPVSYTHLTLPTIYSV